MRSSLRAKPAPTRRPSMGLRSSGNNSSPPASGTTITSHATTWTVPRPNATPCNRRPRCVNRCSRPSPSENRSSPGGRPPRPRAPARCSARRSPDKPRVRRPATPPPPPGRRTRPCPSPRPSRLSFFFLALIRELFLMTTDNPTPPDLPDADLSDADPTLQGPDFDGIDLSGLPADVAEKARAFAKQTFVADLAKSLTAVARPINWRTLPPADLEHELLELNGWVDWLRHTYGLPAQVVPPMWHRHPELLWELSALRQHWLFCFDPQAKGNQALAWHHDFSVARERLRDWVTISGTRLDRDRPTHVTAWPGGESEDWTEPDTAERPVAGRTDDFLAFVDEQVAARRAEQDATIRSVIADEHRGR